MLCYVMLYLLHMHIMMVHRLLELQSRGSINRQISVCQKKTENDRRKHKDLRHLMLL